MNVQTFPEMNQRIVNLLRQTGNPVKLYAAQRIEELEEALRYIDTHIRSTHEPIPYIVETLKRVLPEYQEEGGGIELA